MLRGVYPCGYVCTEWGGWVCAHVRVSVGVLGGVGVYWMGCLGEAVCVSKCICVYLSILCARVLCVCVSAGESVEG